MHGVYVHIWAHSDIGPANLDFATWPQGHPVTCTPGPRSALERLEEVNDADEHRIVNAQMTSRWCTELYRAARTFNFRLWKPDRTITRPWLTNSHDSSQYLNQTAQATDLYLSPLFSLSQKNAMPFWNSRKRKNAIPATYRGMSPHRESNL